MRSANMQLNKIIIVVFLTIAVLSITGCNMDTSTIIKPDGSGTTTTTIKLTDEEMKDLRKLPNFNEYITSWGKGLKETGQNEVELNGNTIVITRRFKDITELANNKNQKGKVKTWVNIERIKQPFGTKYIYTANIDTRDLYAKEGIIGNQSDIRDEVYKNLNAVLMTYSVTLPGDVVYSNTSSTSTNGKMTWTIPMSSATRIRAESETKDSRVTLVFKIGVASVIGILLYSFILVLFSAVVYRRSRIKKKVTNGE